MFFAAQVLAATAVNLLETPDIVEKAKADLAETMDGRTYESMIPAGQKPAILKEQ